MNSRDRPGTGPGGITWLGITGRAARWSVITLHAAALVVVALEILHPFSAGDHGVERVAALDFTASYAVYGFVACVLLVLLGRVLRSLVMRDENYYDGDGDGR